MKILFVALLLAVPSVLHADPLMTGQFSVQGSVSNDTTTGSLSFYPGTIETGGTASDFTGSFSTILSPDEFATAGTPNFSYTAYVPDSSFVQFGNLTATLETVTYTVIGGAIPLYDFSGTVLLHDTADGFADTQGVYGFTTQGDGAVTFSATALASSAPAVPEPTTLGLVGTGLLGIAGTFKKRTISA